MSLASAGTIFSFGSDCTSEQPIMMGSHDRISTMGRLSMQEYRWKEDKTVSTLAFAKSDLHSCSDLCLIPILRRAA
jgi:hypothetical protein